MPRYYPIAVDFLSHDETRHGRDLQVLSQHLELFRQHRPKYHPRYGSPKDHLFIISLLGDDVRARKSPVQKSKAAPIVLDDPIIRAEKTSRELEKKRYTDIRFTHRRGGQRY